MDCFIPEEQVEERTSLDYDMEDLREVTPTPALNLKGITETACYEPWSGEPYMVFFCESARRYVGPCPHCGSTDHYVHAKLSENRLVHDVNRWTSASRLTGINATIAVAPLWSHSVLWSMAGK